VIHRIKCVKVYALFSNNKVPFARAEQLWYNVCALCTMQHNSIETRDLGVMDVYKGLAENNCILTNMGVDHGGTWGTSSPGIWIGVTLMQIVPMICFFVCSTTPISKLSSSGPASVNARGDYFIVYIWPNCQGRHLVG